MSLFGGIDYDSEGVYLALVDEDTGRLVAHRKHDLACGPGDSFDRARRVADLTPKRSSWTLAGVLAIGIEATYSHAFKAAVALARVQGAILATLPRDLLVLPLAAQHHGGWKERTVGKTTASKSDVAAWALDQGCPAGLPQDVYDAFAIARAAAEIWETRHERTAA